jgi:putative transposase
MPQSLSKVILHIIFSTKNREPWLESNVRPRVHAYLATVCRDLGAELVRVGGVVDHVHIVTTLPRTLSHADLVERIKKTFSKSLPSTPPPLLASGERIEVRGVLNPRGEV